MAAEFVTDTLKSMGPAGAAISVLMATVTTLATAVVFQYKHSNKVYGYRLQERDTLTQALMESAAAIQTMTRAAEERNRSMQELAEAIREMAHAFERHKDNVNHATERQKEHTEAVKDLAEKVGNCVGVVSVLKDAVNQGRRSSRR